MRGFPHMPEIFRALRVLVVEDELLIRWSIAETLGHLGHTVVQAEDGATAIRTLQSDGTAPDAVVLDYRLPDSNDLTLLTTIRGLAPVARGDPDDGIRHAGGDERRVGARRVPAC